jgi:hypothetical protein
MIRRASTAALRDSSGLLSVRTNAHRATRLAVQKHRPEGGFHDLSLRALGNVYSLTEGYFGRGGTPL